MTKRTATYLLLLGAWVLGIILPLHSFRRLSSSYRVAFDWAFGAQWAHVAMHVLLYAVLACLLSALVSQHVRSSKRTGLYVLIAVALVALSQEFIQAIFAGMSLGSPAVFDFFVDAGGGLIGTMLFARINRRQ